MTSYHNAFDGAGIGRPSEFSSQCASAYNSIERQLSRDDLHAFHINGADILLHVDPPLNLKLEHQLLCHWMGPRAFVSAIGGSLGLNDRESADALMYYGADTGALLKALLPAFDNYPILWLDTFYESWSHYLARHGDERRTISTIQIICDTADVNLHAQLAASISSHICDAQPRVVFLSHVTQFGVRLPVETIIEAVVTQWRTSGPQWRPLFILDGCQSFGRVPLDLSVEPFKDQGCVFMACMHKAICGPKEMGVLWCTDAGWQSQIQRAINTAESLPSLFRYAQTRGTAPFLSTVDFERVVVAALIHGGRTLEQIRKHHEHILGLEQLLRNELASRSLWTVANPTDKRLWSGILMLRPPLDLRGLSAGALKRLLGDTEIVDQINNAVRIAIGAHHNKDDMIRLVNHLNEVASPV